MAVPPTCATAGQEAALDWREDEGCLPQESEHMSDEGCSSSHENSCARSTVVEVSAALVHADDSCVKVPGEAASAEAAAPSAARSKDVSKLNRLAMGARRLRLKNRNRHIALMDAMDVPIETDFVTGLELALSRLQAFQHGQRAAAQPQMQWKMVPEAPGAQLLSTPGTLRSVMVLGNGSQHS